MTSNNEDFVFILYHTFNLVNSIILAKQNIFLWSIKINNKNLNHLLELYKLLIDYM